MIWLGFFYTWNQILWTNYLYDVFYLSPCCGLGGKWVGVKLGRLHSYLSEQKNICVRLIDWGFKSYVFYSQLVYSFSSSFLGFCCWFSFLYLQDIQKAHARQIVAVFKSHLSLCICVHNNLCFYVVFHSCLNRMGVEVRTEELVQVEVSKSERKISKWTFKPMTSK